MHGMLALSAVHLATLQPHRKAELVNIAFKAERVALPSFRRYVNHYDQNNVNVVFAFSSFLIIYTLAISGLYENENARIPALGGSEPHWLLVMRGNVQFLANNWPDISQGPFRDILSTELEHIEYSTNPDDHRLVKLHHILIPNNPEEQRAFESCRDALDELRRVSSLKLIVPGAAIFAWPGRVSNEYLKLVSDRRPQALVILAHYAVLVKKSNLVWYLGNAGEKLLEAINRELDDEWKPYIKWAMEVPSQRTRQLGLQSCQSNTQELPNAPQKTLTS